MILQYLKDALAPLASVAASWQALLGYVFAILVFGLLTLRLQRNKQVLAKIKDLPEKDRKAVIQMDLGVPYLREGMTSVAYLKYKRQQYYLYGFLTACALVLALYLVARLTPRQVASERDNPPLSVCKDIYIQRFERVVPEGARGKPLVLDFDGRLIALPIEAASDHTLITLSNYDAGTYDVRVLVPTQSTTIDQVVQHTRTEERVVEVPSFRMDGGGGLPIPRIVMERQVFQVPIVDSRTEKVEVTLPEVVIAKARVELGGAKAYLMRVRGPADIVLDEAVLGIERLKSESKRLATLPSCTNTQLS